MKANNQDYKKLFDNATISIWNEDFTAIIKEIDELRKQDISNIKIYLEQNPEVLLSLFSKLKINSVNDATLKMFKAENSRAFLNNVLNTFGEGAEKVLIKLIDAIWNREKSFTSEVNFKTFEGGEFIALFSIYIPQTESELHSVPATIQSIQRLKEAELSKEESLIKLEQAQKIGNIGSWEWDFKTDKSVWSDEMYRIHGVTKGEFNPTSKNVILSILDEDKHKMENATERIMRGEYVDSFEFRIRRPNNEIRELNIIALQVSKGVVFGVTQDITERKKTENKLNEAQSLAKVGSWLFSPISKKLEWSDEMFQIWGFDIGNPVPHYDDTTSRVHRDSLDILNTAVNAAFSNGTPYDIEFRIVLPNNVRKTIRSICKPILGDDGKVVSLAGTNQDITAQKQLEGALIKGQRLQAMGEMSSSIAHDFNNSLQEILGNLEVVKLQSNLSERSLERINNIGSIVSDVAGRVSSLQKFGDTKLDYNNTESIDINSLIEEGLKESRPMWKDGMEKRGISINIITDFKEIPRIDCNRGELKSVIYNIIKNSIEAMPKGGEIVIKTGVKPEGIYATFTDTGEGMNEDVKLKIFQPYFSTKGFKLGRGLGMSGAYSTVKKHKGDIAVQSSGIDKGTIIEITFPISQKKETVTIIENKSQDKTPLNVLWVDDDFLITKSSSIMVKSIGHNCMVANSGKNALDYLNNQTCDIVFTDIGMPIMNGWELVDSIRAKFGDKIIIVVVSGWDIEEKEKHKIDFSLQKPFSLEHLNKIFEQVNKRLRIN